MLNFISSAIPQLVWILLLVWGVFMEFYETKTISTESVVGYLITNVIMLWGGFWDPILRALGLVK